jgi:hypothetical protein
VGRVLAIEPDSTVVAFFIHGGRRRIDEHIAPLEDVPVPDDDTRHMLGLAAAVDWRTANHNVYVIELNPKVFSERRFLEKNRGYIPGTKPCVYVGMTGLTPEERFKNHLAGNKANSYVTRYGLRLCPELYGGLNPMPHDLTKGMESWLAQYLRGQGYGVWQN